MHATCDLPGTALQHIQQFAVGRRVLGTNKYASVSRAWCAASHAWDWEPLRLCLDLDALEQQQLQDAILWYTTHGQQVQLLSIQGFQRRSFPVLQQLWVAPKSFRSLTWLEVGGIDTLVNLAPLLDQLAQLQHLKASISLRQEVDVGYFCTDDLGQQQALAAVPVLQGLCPQLRGLHLVIYSSSSSSISSFNSSCMDPRLQHLLPCGLEQLQLEVDYSGDSPQVWGEMGPPRPRLDPASLAGCTALQQLTLQHMQLDDCLPLAHLSSLQTIRMVDVVVADEQLLHLKGKLVQYLGHTRVYWEDTQALSQLTALTALTICQIEYKPETLSEYCLTSLGALRHLAVLEVWREDLGNPRLLVLLQQLAGLPQLRDLHLSRYCVQRALPGLGALRQLTGLYISGLVAIRDDEPTQADAHLGNMLQQLTGLQRLEVHPALVTTVSQPWWTSLTALTQLGVVSPLLLRWDSVRDSMGNVQAALVAGTFPASLQHLVFKIEVEVDQVLVGPRCCVEASMLPGVIVTSWKLRPHMMMDEVLPPCTPCPWLPGVWEVPEGP